MVTSELPPALCGLLTEMVDRGYSDVSVEGRRGVWALGAGGAVKITARHDIETIASEVTTLDLSDRVELNGHRFRISSTPRTVTIRLTSHDLVGEMFVPKNINIGRALAEAAGGRQLPAAAQNG